MAAGKNVLGIDTATLALVLGVGDSNGLLASHFSMIGRRHLELSIGLIEEILQKSELGLSDLSAVSCGLGPGSLIGSRVGVVIAKTLAQVLRVPIIGISTLDIIALSGQKEGLRVVAIDALRDEIYWAAYKDGKKITEYKVSSAEAMVEELDGEKAVVKGTAIIKYGRFFNKFDNLVASNTLYPAPEALVSVAFEKLNKDEKSSLYDLEPIYLRSPV
ncbi:hypothetical protein LCGC14_1221180 [marine sediment metagenome]|uniref:Gcp-like domain-containing protein n=1 Tax=marine sediment metagenome TaxID=412755 RepID=A0A0F9LYD1_9ZZZZ